MSGSSPAIAECAAPAADAAGVHPVVARLLTFAFAVLVAGVPIADTAIEVSAHLRGARIQPLPTACEMGAVLLDAVFMYDGTAGTVAQRVSGTARVLALGQERHARAVAEASVLRRHVRPAIQSALARHPGAGSAGVAVGRNGWLFDKVDIAHVTGRGFLDRPVASAGPVEAVAQFHEALAARGIRLLVVPVPGKLSVFPEHFSRRVGKLRPWRLPRNGSWPAFLEAMEARGIDVLDAGPSLGKGDGPPRPTYGASDSRWSTTGVRFVSRAFEGLLEGISNPVSRPIWMWSTSDPPRGDLARRIDPTGRWPVPGEAEAHAVGVSGWKPDKTADVLLVGDSLCEIYTLASAGWGTGAGLAETLAHSLGRPVDLMTRTAGGAWSGRQMVAEALAMEPDRMKSKRFVIWVFADSELSSGNWRPIRWPVPAPRAAGETTVPPRLIPPPEPLHL